MKGWLIVAAVILAVILAIGAVLYGLRLFNQAVTPMAVHRPEQGIVCVSMVTADGVALSCFSEAKK